MNCPRLLSAAARLAASTAGSALAKYRPGSESTNFWMPPVMAPVDGSTIGDGERHLVSQSLQAGYVIASLVTSMESVEMAFAEILIVDAIPTTFGNRHDLL
jgi:hypothetical protein